MLARPAWTLPQDLSARVVIFGAGGLGRKIASVLRNLGYPPLAFCDNNPALWGTQVEGIPVLSVPNAVSSFSHALFVIAIWHPSKTEGLRHHTSTLRSLGCKEVTGFIPLFWRYPEYFLPNMFWELPEKLSVQLSFINAARDLLDKHGQEEFDRQLHFHLSGDATALHDPVPGLQYFPEDIVQLSPDEVFVDCGAYNGDTVSDFYQASGGRFRRLLAFEPDERNFRKLATSVTDDRVVLKCTAVGAKRETARMQSSGASSSISESGDLQIECATLDELLADENPSFIKMDIEGSEVDALVGATKTLRRCRPNLAICVYHRPDDLWRIPLLLNELLPGSLLTMRSHMLDGFDTVCYCFPRR